jgi:hypothetical protein
VAEVVLAYNEGRIDDAQFVVSVVALPINTQAKRPTDTWFDAIEVRRGPIFHALDVRCVR